MNEWGGSLLPLAQHILKLLFQVLKEIIYRFIIIQTICNKWMCLFFIKRDELALCWGLTVPNCLEKKGHSLIYNPRRSHYETHAMVKAKSRKVLRLRPFVAFPFKLYIHKSSLHKRKKLRGNNHTHEPKPPTTNISNMLMKGDRY